jgi:hypothetical protein
MNWLIHTADRTTNLKIVVIGFAAAPLIGVVGISAYRLNLGTDVMSLPSKRHARDGALGCEECPKILRIERRTVFNDNQTSQWRGPCSNTSPVVAGFCFDPLDSCSL